MHVFLMAVDMHINGYIASVNAVIITAYKPKIS